MKATAWEFRYRLWISCAIIVLGFAAPWIEVLNLGNREVHTWGWLAVSLGRLGLPMLSGFELVAALAIAAAAIATLLRVSGTAYLGAGTVFNAEMKAGADEPTAGVMADGPYRYMRNPLYAGSFLTVAALAVLMPPSGAAVSLVLLGIFLVRLILGEEAFLAPRLGESYAAYCRAVPRLLPSLRARVGASRQLPNWKRALLGEIFPSGVLLSFAALSWQYNPDLLAKAVLISFGLSLVVRGFIVPNGIPSQTA